MKLCNLIAVILFSANIAFADSPLTSTLFYNAYIDIPIITRAEKESVMNKDFADYLHSDYTTIDKKAALINALGWENAVNNTEIYCKEIFGRKITATELSTLGADDAFVIGYLMALDNYHTPSDALPFLKYAREEIDDSFTATMILALVKAQIVMEKDFCKAWKYANNVFKNDDLEKDMRKQGREIIYNYMILYKDECKK